MSKSTDESRVYDYPLLSGKKLGEATTEDCLAEVALEGEIEAIEEEMGDMTLDQFFRVSPVKALRLVAYFAQCDFLADYRAEALGVSAEELATCPPVIFTSSGLPHS